MSISITFVYSSQKVFKKVGEIKDAIRAKIHEEHSYYPTFDFWDDFIISVFDRHSGKELDDETEVDLSEGYGYKILPVFTDKNKERLIQSLETTIEEILNITQDSLGNKIGELNDDDDMLLDLPNLYSSQEFLNLFQTAFDAITSSSYNSEHEIIFQHYLEFQNAVDLKGVDFHCPLAYDGGPSRLGLYFERLYVPIAVALAGTLGALVAAAEPLGAVAVGGVSGVTSLIINLLSDRFHGEYRPDKEVILELLSEKYNPVRIGVIWCLLRFQCPMTIAEISRQLPYAESSVRYWIKELEKETIVIPTNTEKKPMMWEMNRKYP